MRYVSTRGRAEPAGFVDVLLGGRAPDGGVWVPEPWPQLSPDEVAACAARSFADTAADLVLRFAGIEIDPDAVADAAREAAAAFVHTGVAPLSELAPNLWLHDPTWGPTGHGADFEMQVLARLAEVALAQRRERRTFVAAGEEAIAAAFAVAGRSRMRLIAVIPADAADEPLGRRLAALNAANVRAVAVEAPAAGVRGLVDGLMSDPGLSEVARLGSLGPENPARIPLQAAAWIAAAARLGAPARPVFLAAPAEAGAFAAGAWAALRMGLPARVVLAGEPGSPLAGMLADGRVRVPVGTAPTAELERLYFDAIDREAVETARAMAAVPGLGGFDLPPRARAALAGLMGAEVDAVDAARSQLELRNASGVFAAPETAAVVAAARRLADDAAGPVILPALAHPGLYAGAIERVPGEAPPALRGPAPAAPGRAIERIACDLFALKAWVRDTAGLSRAA